VSKYLDKNKKFKKGNPGGPGRPRNPKTEDYELIVEKYYNGWIDECCELANVKDVKELSSMVQTQLLNAKKVQLQIEILTAKYNLSKDDQKLLNTLTGRVNNMLKDAHSILKAQIMINREKGKGGDKPIGMY